MELSGGLISLIAIVPYAGRRRQPNSLVMNAESNTTPLFLILCLLWQVWVGGGGVVSLPLHSGRQNHFKYHPFFLNGPQNITLDSSCNYGARALIGSGCSLPWLRCFMYYIN